MSEPTAALPRFTIRQLPIAAKLVVALFLISVGIGYFSALVQLHMQHSDRGGNAMPTPDDVIEKFAGVQSLAKVAGALPVSKVETILRGPKDGGFDKTNMAPAFFNKSSGYDKECKECGKEVVDELRAGELASVLDWVRTSREARKQAYDDNKLAVTPGRKVTEDYFDAAANTVAIKSVIEDRCIRCHNGEVKPDMSDWGTLEPLVTAPTVDIIDGKWVKSTRQTSVEGLTQSTHVHLLAFSMLFSLTGIVFAFTGYPSMIRAMLAPLVLLAQIADISCWWLARLPEVGPSFALVIIGTGTVVGLGLAAQIVLSLFDLFDRRGKAAMAVVFALGAAVFGTLVVTVIEPALKAERVCAAERANEAAAKGAKPAAPVRVKGDQPPAPRLQAEPLAPARGRRGEDEPPARQQAEPLAPPAVRGRAAPPAPEPETPAIPEAK